MSLVQLRNVFKRLGENPVLSDVSLSVRERELFVLVGPSGCGKSTLLRLIAGLDRPDAGEVLIDGRNVAGVPPKDRNVAMVFQNHALYPHMTVYDNLAFGLRVRGYSQREIDLRVGEAAEALSIGALLRRRPQQLSGGERQRAALGRAIVRKPRVFLFDEPLSNLDAQLRVQMRGELIQLHSQLKTTMIYVTHDQVEAMTLGERLCVMKQGSPQQLDRPMDVYRRPANRFVASFIGSPAMNFFPVTVLEKDNGFWLDQGAFQLRLPPRFHLGCPLAQGQRLVLGVRPEDVHDRLFQPAAAENGNTVLAIVQFLEPVGAETYVHAEAGGASITARVDPANPIQANHPIELAFNMDKTHLFTEDGRERLALEV